MVRWLSWTGRTRCLRRGSLRHPGEPPPPRPSGLSRRGVRSSTGGGSRIGSEGWWPKTSSKWRAAASSRPARATHRRGGGARQPEQGVDREWRGAEDPSSRAQREVLDRFVLACPLSAIHPSTVCADDALRSPSASANSNASDANVRARGRSRATIAISARFPNKSARREPGLSRGEWPGSPRTRWRAAPRRQPLDTSRRDCSARARAPTDRPIRASRTAFCPRISPPPPGRQAGRGHEARRERLGRGHRPAGAPDALLEQGHRLLALPSPARNPARCSASARARGARTGVRSSASASHLLVSERGRVRTHHEVEFDDAALARHPVRPRRAPSEAQRGGCRAQRQGASIHEA